MKKIISLTMLGALLCLAQPAERPQQLVAVQKATLQYKEEVKRYTGRLVSPSTVLITSRVSGEIVEIGFKDGDVVKKGQLLYKLDPVQYYATLKAEEARVEICKANIAQAEASLEIAKAKQLYAQNNFDRNQALFNKGVVTKDTYEAAKKDIDAENASTQAAIATLASAKASLKEAEANLIKAQDDYKNTTIVAPMDGLAGVTEKTVGNYITPATGTLVTLIQTNPMRARFSVAMGEYLSFVDDNGKLGNIPEIKMILADGTTYGKEGTLELINNEINRNTDTIQMFALFKNDNNLLRHGSTVSMYLQFRSADKKLAVYPSCIMHDPKGAYVYVVDAENKVARRDVTLDLATSDWQFISSGLQENDVVIKDGMHKTMPGDTVKTTEEDTVNRE